LIGQQPLRCAGCAASIAASIAPGTRVFTDRACADLDATPALPQGDAAPDASPLPGGPRSPQLCAATLDELRQQVVDAFAARDPNRLAGLMLWGRLQPARAWSNRSARWAR
jgi:hypothetical protein